MKWTLVILAASTGIGLATALVFGWFRAPELHIDPSNPRQVALGKQIYDQHCGRCHGANLEGQPNWRTRKPDGRMPAPPHDASGHTWEHTDAQLF